MNKILVAILATIVFIVAFFGIIGCKNKVKIVINDTVVENANAQLVDNTLYVPLRAVFENMGYSVQWNAATRTAVLKNSQNNVEISADEAVFYVNGNKVISDKSQLIINNSLYLPLRVAVESVGCNVEWDKNTCTAYIYFKNNDLNMDINKDFAFRLNECMPKDVNYVFSPLSVKLAFAMAANGAKGQTEDEIIKTLGIENIDNYNSYVKDLISYYATDNSDEYRKDVVFDIANSVWLNKDYLPNVEFSEEFSDNVKKYYAASVSQVNNDNATNIINSWVSDKTNGLIDGIIDSPEFLSALVNACYFKANWQNKFEEYDTKKDTFTYRNGDKSEIDFMNITDNFKYYADDKVQLVSLPYSGTKNISMYIALSNDKRMDYSQYFDKCQYKNVHISVPKFKVEFSTALNDILKAMGIKKCFSVNEAEFQPMFKNYSDDISFYISKVLHKAYINVDEDGTEAAAVTAVLTEATGIEAPEILIEFVADKPFTYIVRDNDNKEILFMGEFACK